MPLGLKACTNFRSFHAQHILTQSRIPGQFQTLEAYLPGGLGDKKTRLSPAAFLVGVVAQVAEQQHLVEQLREQGFEGRAPVEVCL